MCPAGVLIRKGAEANLYREGSALVKDRISKGYREAALDYAIRKARTKAEAKLLSRAREAGVLVPRVLGSEEFSLSMDFVDGPRVKDALCRKNMKALCSAIGSSVARLHNAGIIHGDLTTSNMIIIDAKTAKATKAAGVGPHKSNEGKESPDGKAPRVCFIDFGLGFFSGKTEDKATDIHLMSEAFESTHCEIAEECFKAFLSAYSRSAEGAKETIGRLAQIEKRGRYVKR